MENPTALVLMDDELEEVEVITCIDLLRRADVTVTTASLSSTLMITGHSDIGLEADTLFADLPDPENFDCLIISGGPWIFERHSDPKLLQLTRSYHDAGKWTCAICAAPWVLHNAKLLEDKPYTAHFSVKEQLSAILSEQKVVVAKPCITSQGVGTAIPFALMIIEKLCSKEKSEEVATSICYLPNN